MQVKKIFESAKRGKSLFCLKPDGTESDSYFKKKYYEKTLFCSGKNGRLPGNFTQLARRLLFASMHRIRDIPDRAKNRSCVVVWG